MFVIWSFKSRQIKEETTTHVRCKNCQEAGMIYLVMQRFFHLFFVPLVPLLKTHFLSCGVCEETYAVDKNDPELLSHSASTPWWGFIGPVFVGAVALLAALAHQEEQKLIADVFDAPRAGDVVYYKLSEPQDKKHPYAFLKIIAVEEGEVIYQHSAFDFSDPKLAKDFAHGKTDEHPDSVYPDQLGIALQDFRKYKEKTDSVERAEE